MNVRTLLDWIRAPTVIVHRRGDRAIPYGCAPELAASIPDARLISLEGTAHFPWAGNSMSVARAMRLRLLPEHRSAPGAGAVSVLSGREREVLALVASGLSDREIAERLTVSPHTAHRHVANIRRKLGSGSRASAVTEAARLGLI